VWRAALLSCTLLACGKSSPPGPTRVRLDALGVELTVPVGFLRDRSAEVKDPSQGGILLRLVRQNAVSGSPRIDVVAQPASPRPTALDDFLAQNLAEMAELERGGNIRITRVERSALTIGPRRGYRVRHEYEFAGGEVAITQIATLLVLDGRGVAVTAVGRTELFAPYATLIEQALGGIRTPLPTERSPDGRSLTQPVDLHEVVQPGR
jgi:hypothetical protein